MLLPAAGFAQGGTTGSLTWSLSGGTLTISGSGAMPDFIRQESPWYDYGNHITAVIIEAGVTRIGNFAF